MKASTIIIGAVAAIAVGSATAYIVMTNQDLRSKLIRTAKDTISTSKQTVKMVSEDVALRTAKLTKNPKVNQDWVDKQWEAVLDN